MLNREILKEAAQRISARVHADQKWDPDSMFKFLSEELERKPYREALNELVVYLNDTRRDPETILVPLMDQLYLARLLLKGLHGGNSEARQCIFDIEKLLKLKPGGF